MFSYYSDSSGAGVIDFLAYFHPSINDTMLTKRGGGGQGRTPSIANDTYVRSRGQAVLDWRKRFGNLL